MSNDRRIACLFLADLPLAAALRADPSLVGTAFVVAEGLEGRSRLLSVSPAAAALGVRADISLAQARAVIGELDARANTAAALRSVSDALLDVARSFAARVERATQSSEVSDCVFLEVGDLGRLFPRETGLAAAIEAAARKVGLSVRLGIASTKAAARIAARQCADGAAILVPTGQERAFLAPLSVALADPDKELAAALARFGLRTLGAVAALPGDGLGRRLGREGAALWRLARGEDDTTLNPETEAEVFAEAVALDYALDSTEPLSFLLQGALSRLCARLSARGLACSGLTLELSLAPYDAHSASSHSRAVAVAAPTLEAPVLVSLARLSLEAEPPPGSVHAFRVVADAGPAPSAQLGLFDPLRPAPARLAATLARLSALCGSERVGAPALVDSLRPEASAVAPFTPEPPAPRRVARAPKQGSLFPASDAASQEGAHAPHADTPAMPCRVLTLRKVEPPRAAHVRLWSERPISLDGTRLVHVAGPWRIGGQWWTPLPFARDYYDVETAAGHLLRVYHTGPEDTWWVDGVYD